MNIKATEKWREGSNLPFVDPADGPGERQMAGKLDDRGPSAIDEFALTRFGASLATNSLQDQATALALSDLPTGTDP